MTRKAKSTPKPEETESAETTEATEVQQEQTTVNETAEKPAVPLEKPKSIGGGGFHIGTVSKPGASMIDRLINLEARVSALESHQEQ